MVKSKLLGFSIRNGKLLDGEWDVERRRLFLLNENVEIPFSVDSNVWSIPAGLECSPLDPESVPLWRSRQAMLEFARNSGVVGNGLMYEVAVSVLGCSMLPDWMRLQEVDQSAELSEADSGFLFRGFDVADLSLISGLSNCAYGIEEKADLQRRFARSLNDVGLIAQLDAAKEWRRVADVRAPAHAPFLVFSIEARAIR